ncbi:MAG: hypothetical protein R3E49_06305 [Haliea sp.]
MSFVDHYEFEMFVSKRLPRLPSTQTLYRREYMLPFKWRLTVDKKFAKIGVAKYCSETTLRLLENLFAVCDEQQIG